MADQTTPRKGFGLKYFIGALLFITLLTGLGVFKVWINYRTVSFGYELSSQVSTYQKLLQLNQELRLEYEALKDLDALRDQALAEWGMEEPGTKEIIYVKDTPPTVQKSKEGP